jgi:hypothetical protein
MKRSMVFLLVSFATVSVFAGQQLPYCGKESGRALVMQSFIDDWARINPKPELPPGFDRGALPATVRLRLFVDRRGKVIEVCLPTAERKKSNRQTTLNIAVAEGVRRWTYPRDFGLKGNLRPKANLATGIVTLHYIKK